MGRIDMDKMLADAVAEVEASAANRVVARSQMYDALLAHVADFEYLTSRQDPTAQQPGYLIFSVGDQFRLRVECNIKVYRFYHQRCPKGSSGSKHWSACAFDGVFEGRPVRHLLCAGRNRPPK